MENQNPNIFSNKKDDVNDLDSSPDKFASFFPVEDLAKERLEKANMTSIEERSVAKVNVLGKTFPIESVSVNSIDVNFDRKENEKIESNVNHSQNTFDNFQNTNSEQEAINILNEAQEKIEDENIAKNTETFLGEQPPVGTDEHAEYEMKKEKVYEYLKKVNPDIKKSQWEIITGQIISIEDIQDEDQKKLAKQQLILGLSTEIGISEAEAEMLFSTLYANRHDMQQIEDTRAVAFVTANLGLKEGKQYAKAIDNNDTVTKEEIENALPEELRNELKKIRKYSLILKEQDEATKNEEENKKEEKKEKLISKKFKDSLQENGALEKFNNMDFTEEETKTMEEMTQKAGSSSLIAEVLKNDSQKIGSVVQGKILNVYVLLRLDTKQVEFIGEHAVREVVSPKAKYIIEPPNPEQFNISYISMLAEQNGMSSFTDNSEGIETNVRMAKIIAGDLANGNFITEDGANMHRMFLKIMAGGKEKNEEEKALYDWGVKERGSDSINERRLIHIRNAFLYFMDGNEERNKDFDDFAMNHDDVTTLCMVWDKNEFDYSKLPNNLQELKDWTQKLKKAPNKDDAIEEILAGIGSK